VPPGVGVVVVGAGAGECREELEGLGVQVAEGARELLELLEILREVEEGCFT